jgi:hypothetical protein
MSFVSASVHRSAWNRNSANFAFWGFSEVRRSILAEALPTLNEPDIVRGYASFGTSDKGVMALEGEVLMGLAMYWWVVFVLWATRRDWE